MIALYLLEKNMKKKILVLILGLILGMAPGFSQSTTVYTPYTGATGGWVKGKAVWGKYKDVRGASIFVGPGEIEISISGTELTYYLSGATKNKGKTKKGNIWIYYHGLKGKDGGKGDIRVEFLDEDWILLDLYTKTTNLRFKCKYLTTL